MALGRKNTKESDLRSALASVREGDIEQPDVGAELAQPVTKPVGNFRNPNGYYRSKRFNLYDPYDKRTFSPTTDTLVEPMTSFVDVQVSAGLLELVKEV